MRDPIGGRGLAILATLPVLVACIPHAPRRVAHPVAVETTVAHLADPEARQEVRKYAVEVHPTFDLAFVEFDDQGRLWSLDQIESLKHTLALAVDRTDGGGVGVIAFAHGWDHDARVCDDFVACFRAFLAVVASDTAAAASAAGSPPPRIVGVYLGWRGRSTVLPGAGQLTFWPRKRTAERIGAGELVQVLEYLDVFTHRESDAGRLASLSIIGHSFGGTMVDTALSNTLKARLVDALDRHERAPSDDNVVHGFGDLVVLVNPAFEASAFAPLHELAAALGDFSPRPSPVLVVVGSETDTPNRVWFRAGRWVQTFFQASGPRSEPELLTTAVGSYEPFQTHRVEAIDPPGARPPCRSRRRLQLGPSDRRAVGRGSSSGRRVPEDPAFLPAVGRRGGPEAVRLPAVTPTRPVWSVRATDDVVRGHSGFFTRPFMDFIRHLILGALSGAMTPDRPVD